MSITDKKPTDSCIQDKKFRKVYKYIIGIDTGLNTGICVWDVSGRFIQIIETLRIHKAMNVVRSWQENPACEILVRVEDARKRKWFGKGASDKVQGAGSIKRDAKIWEDFLIDLGVDFEMVDPKNNTTKISQEYFNKLSGHNGRCSVHARDAAMLVIGL
jgi:hypothetical protein